MRSLQDEVRRAKAKTQGGAKDAVTMFLNNIGNLKLLSRHEEVELAKLVQAGLPLQQWQTAQFEASGAHPSHAETAAHFGLSQQEASAALHACATAKELLMQYNTRLVVSIAKRYTDKGVHLADLIPEGIDGLLRAVEKFDPGLGYKLSTYAHWWIRQAVSRCITTQARVVRLPSHVYECVGRIARVKVQLQADPTRTTPVTNKDIADALDLPVSKVDLYTRASRPTRSLETPQFAAGGKGEEDGASLMENCSEELGVEGADESLQDKLRQEAQDELISSDMNMLLSTLHPRERNVIRMRYGLHSPNGSTMSFTEIGAAYGMSKDRIRTIEAKALAKMRTPWRRALITHTI